ncbi:MAG: hypothetical protein WCQ91_03510, partial [Planctomycetota bacterium]
ISERPPREALDRKRSEATRAFTETTSGDHIRGTPEAPSEHGQTSVKPSRKQPRDRRTVGYRPKRPGQ